MGKLYSLSKTPVLEKLTHAVFSQAVPWVPTPRALGPTPEEGRGEGKRLPSPHRPFWEKFKVGTMDPS